MSRARLVVAGLLLVGAPARADDLTEVPRNRQGSYTSFGIAASLALASEDGETLGPINGFAATVRTGEMLTTHFGIGFIIDFGGGSGDGQSMGFGGLALAAQVEVAHNLAAHAAAGLAIVTLESPDDDPDASSRGVSGAGYTLGVTYDWFPWQKHDKSGGWAVTPGFWVRAVPGGTDAYLMLFSVQATYWGGLPKNQQDLPPGQGY